MRVYIYWVFSNCNSLLRQWKAWFFMQFSFHHIQSWIECWKINAKCSLKFEPEILIEWTVGFFQTFELQTIDIIKFFWFYFSAIQLFFHNFFQVTNCLGFKYTLIEYEDIVHYSIAFPLLFYWGSDIRIQPSTLCGLTIIKIYKITQLWIRFYTVLIFEVVIKVYWKLIWLWDTSLVIETGSQFQSF